MNKTEFENIKKEEERLRLILIYFKDTIKEDEALDMRKAVAENIISIEEDLRKISLFEGLNEKLNKEEVTNKILNDVTLTFGYIEAFINTLSVIQKDVMRVIKSFRRFYPEEDISIDDITFIETEAFVKTTFPDGEFYFIVNDCYISSSFTSFEDALKTIAPLPKAM